MSYKNLSNAIEYIWSYLETIMSEEELTELKRRFSILVGGGEPDWYVDAHKDGEVIVAKNDELEYYVKHYPDGTRVSIMDNLGNVYSVGDNVYAVIFMEDHYVCVNSMITSINGDEDLMINNQYIVNVNCVFFRHHSNAINFINLLEEGDVDNVN